MTWDETLNLLMPCMPSRVNDALATLEANSLREIRIRSGQDVQLCCAQEVIRVSCQADTRDVGRICEALTGHSLYARSAETAMGYVTLRGGHRMGLCGQVHLRDSQLHMQHISSLCLRIAADHPGCAQRLIPFARESLLLIGPPGSGKTTLLRDLARLMSLEGRQTAVMDERCELSACTDGTPQLDIGCADVLCGVPKPEAAAWLVRSMAPQLILTDEIGSDADASALTDAQACGTEIIASVHGRSLNEVVRRTAIRSLISSRIFGAYAVLHAGTPGRIAAIYDRNGNPLSLS